MQHPSNSETVHGSLGTELQPSPPAAWPLNWLCPAAFPHCLLLLQAIYGKQKNKKEQLERSLHRWWTGGGRVGCGPGGMLCAQCSLLRVWVAGACCRKAMRLH